MSAVPMMIVEDRRSAPPESANVLRDRVRGHPVPMVRAHRMVTVEDLKFVPMECADDRARPRTEGREEAAAVRLDQVVSQGVVREAADEVEWSRWNRWRNRWHLTG